MHRILYLSDLDGTLLAPHAVLLPEVRTRLARMLADGLPLTVATARTASTASYILGDLPLDIPAALMNGVLRYRFREGVYCGCVFLPLDSAREAVRLLKQTGEASFLFTFEEGLLHANYEFLTNAAQERYLGARQDLRLKRFVRCESLEALAAGGRSIFLSVRAETREALERMDSALRGLDGLSQVLYQDVNDGSWLLEAFPRAAGKGIAAQELARQFGADELVVFGDNYNDLPMLQAADRAYVVDTAPDEVRAHATGIIPYEQGLGVVKFLENEFYSQ